MTPAGRRREPRGCQIGTLEQYPERAGELLPQRTVDVVLTGLPDSIELRGAFLAAQSFQVFNGSRLTEIFAEDSDVDVLGKTRDQSISLREGCSSFEQKASGRRLQCR